MIKGTPKRLFRKFVYKFFVPGGRQGYSQFGEDLIIDFFFYNLGVRNPSYLDIGANEPRFISNTYFFYEHGSKGVCIEPDPKLFQNFKSARTRDVVINAGIGLKEEGEADFYVFPDSANGLGTFSKKDAEYWGEVGMHGIGKIKYEKVIKVKLIPINSIFREHFNDTAPDFITLDVEGLDEEILRSMDFAKYRPKLICVETLEYDENKKGFKNSSVIEFLESNGYAVYADTRVNTIFVAKELL